MSGAGRPRVPGRAWEVALAAEDVLGEGPHWDAASGRLLRVDIRAGAVRGWRPETGERDELAVGAGASVAIPAACGGLLVAAGDELAIWRDGRAVPLARIDSDRPVTRLNDGKCDARGRLWIGTWATDGAAVAAVHRVSPDGVAVRVLDGLRASNGIAFDGPGELLYVTDSPRGAIDVLDLDLDGGTVACVRPFARIEPSGGIPDGIAADVEGGIWVAVFGGGAVHRYDRGGALDAVVELPVSHPTSVAFGGERRDVLYVTTARHRLSAAEAAAQPLAGSVLAIEPGVAGLPVAAFGAPPDDGGPAGTRRGWT
ncbi:MAG: SMP-30/gluconolactonase/LRE family protein [Solirubrobacterales bacterium]|mgnify:CR=1 FL=1|nr:SMP-30/gluconolactonase/LRE family protein [Solirubrobacterales bacterium]